MTISLCMIVKNEEDVLARCLDSVKDLVEEIIIVDTGSTDRTVEIAQEYTNQVYHYTWMDDFAAARNYSFSYASMDYAMWLDADDILLEEDRERFRQSKAKLDTSVDLVMMPYHVGFDAQGSPNLVYQRERLMRCGRGYQWQGAVHEVITPSGNVITWPAAVTHKKMHPSDPDRNLRIFEKIIQNGQELDPRQQFYYARELFYHQRYQEARDVLEGFLKDERGWVENKISACQDLAACYHMLGDSSKELASLFWSFAYEEPRAEVCCLIGHYFMEQSAYQRAIYWYQRAIERKPEQESGGFMQTDSYDYIPYMQLCVCYDRLGDFKQAWEWHQKAKAVKPEDQNVRINEEYFQKMENLCN